MDQKKTGSTTEVYIEMSKWVFVVLNEMVELLRPYMLMTPEIRRNILDAEAARDKFVAKIKNTFGVDVSTTTTGNGSGVPLLPDLLPGNVQASFKETLGQLNVAKAEFKKLASMWVENTVSATPPVGNDSVPDAKSSTTCAARVAPKRKAKNPVHEEPLCPGAKKKARY